MLSRTRLATRTLVSRQACVPPQIPLPRRSIARTPPFFNDNMFPLPPPPPPPKNKALARLRLVGRFGAYAVFSSVLGVTFITGAIFLHDAFTYSHAHADRVPINPLALNPERGGPKNLPIARVLLSDEEDEEMRKLADKPRLVIIGAGWGAVGVLKNLNPGDYHITVISPDTFNTFTPLLPSAAVGTVSIRSLIEPMRKVIARLRGHFVSAKAVDLVMSERLVEVETWCPKGHTQQRMYIPYDKLIIAVGSSSATHGVPGLEHCHQLKTIADAQAIRRRIFENFEAAALPTTSEEERKRLLSFVVCGGGPTGVETAAEIYDLCNEDILQYFPKVCRNDVSIHVIQSREHILNTYSEAISKYAENKFDRDGVKLITSARVAEVSEEAVTYTTKDKDGKISKYQIPTNFVLWSTGIAMNPFTARVSSLLPNQVNRKAIETDSHLRVKGAPLGDVYAIGDCATIETSLLAHLLEFADDADKNKDGKIDFNEFEYMIKGIRSRFPLAEPHVEKVRELFQKYDSDADNALNLNELATLLERVGSKITSLPATAQVASQQGAYLGKKLTKLSRRTKTLEANGVPKEMQDETVSKPFRYHHLGSLAYIGNAAVFDLGQYSFMGGLAAMYAWRSVYWSEQVSNRTRALLMFDWVIRGVWGRDLSKL